MRCLAAGVPAFGPRYAVMRHEARRIRARAPVARPSPHLTPGTRKRIGTPVICRERLKSWNLLAAGENQRRIARMRGDLDGA